VEAGFSLGLYFTCVEWYSPLPSSGITSFWALSKHSLRALVHLWNGKASRQGWWFCEMPAQSNNSLDTLFGSLWAPFTVLGPRHWMASYATAPVWKKLPLFLRDLGSHLRVVHGNFYWSHPTPYLKWHLSHLSRDQQTDVPQNIGSLIMGWFCIFAPKVSPRGRRAPRLWQFRLAADLRPSARGVYAV